MLGRDTNLIRATLSMSSEWRQHTRSWQSGQGPKAALLQQIADFLQADAALWFARFTNDVGDDTKRIAEIFEATHGSWLMAI